MVFEALQNKERERNTLVSKSFTFYYSILCFPFVISRLHSLLLLLCGFSSNAGKVFSSIPVIVGHEIKLDNTVYTSPVLGRVIVGTRGFMCATEDGQQRSKLRVQRIYNGHPVTADEVRVLLHDGNVAIDTFDDEGNPQQQTLSFDMRTQRVSFHL